MSGLFIAIGVLLVLAIVFTLFRISTLMSAMKGRKEGEVSSNNGVHAILFIVFLVAGFGSVFWYSYTRFDEYNLPVASDHGIQTDQLFWITMAVTGFVFVLTHILLFVFPYLYQYKKDRKALFYADNSTLERVWTLVPAVVLALLIFSGLGVWNKITKEAPQDAEVIEIMGYQFAWKVRYPGKDGKLGNHDFRMIDATNQFGMDLSDKASYDDFTPRHLVIPVNRPVLLKIRARDVLHSVFAPHFRLKMDAVPGMPTSFWFVPNKTTEEMRQELGDPNFRYQIACTEICGKGHFSMAIDVEVVDESTYQKWYADQAPWVDNNMDYIKSLPSDVRDFAMIQTGIKNELKESVVGGM
jgi:cytochrome c oxidase subunit II